jgi:hypothetical protein
MNAAAAPFSTQWGRGVYRRGQGEGVVAAAHLEKRLYPTKDSPRVSKTLLGGVFIIREFGSPRCCFTDFKKSTIFKGTIILKINYIGYFFLLGICVFCLTKGILIDPLM